MIRTKYIVIAAIVVVALLAGTAALTLMTPSTTAPSMTSEKIRVIATFFPMYDHTKNVGGDRVDVSILLPAGKEIHDWDPTPEQIRQVALAKVVVYNGAGLEPFIDRVLQAASPNVVAVEASKGIALLPLEEGGSDFHTWLDPILAKQQVLNIRDALISIDPAGKALYEKNAAEYLAKLDVLDAKIKNALAKTQKKEFVAFHEAFSYFAKRYGLTQHFLLEGLAEEPGPDDIIKVIDIVKKSDIKIIFFEPNLDPEALTKVTEAVPGIKTLPLDPIENPVDAVRLGKTYIGIMEENLNSLLLALE